MPAMKERVRPPDIKKVQRPVERAVAAADDRKILIRENRFVANAVIKAFAFELLLSLNAEPRRRERTRAGGNDHRFRRQLFSGRRSQNVSLFIFNQVLRVLAEHEIGMERGALNRHFSREIFGKDLRKSGHIVNVFLGIQREQLSAKLGQAVDDATRHAAQSGIKRGEQSARAAADDRNVNSLWHSVLRLVYPLTYNEADERSLAGLDHYNHSPACHLLGSVLGCSAVCDAFGRFGHDGSATLARAKDADQCRRHHAQLDLDRDGSSPVDRRRLVRHRISTCVSLLPSPCEARAEGGAGGTGCR